MEILAIVAIVGGILLIIMISNEHRRFNEFIKYHDRKMFIIGRRFWLHRMGLMETAYSFCFIK